MEMSLLELWGQMGWFAKGIVFVMVAMSIYSLTITVAKWWNLRKAQKETIKFAPEFSQFLEEDNLTEAIKLAESYKKSHVALVLGGALGEVKPLIQDGSVTVSDINSSERAIERNMLLEITNLKRGLAVLATVGATAPFVGLLGTTVGIINAFEGMAASGSGGLGVQLLPDEDRQPHGRDDVRLQGDDRLSHQGRLGRVRPVALHPRVQRV